MIIVQSVAVSRKHQLNFSGLHGIISQKIVLSVIAAVRTADST
jgi:hypothetical protein